MGLASETNPGPGLEGLGVATPLIIPSLIITICYVFQLSSTTFRVIKLIGCVFQIKLKGGQYSHNYKKKSYQLIHFKSCGTQMEHIANNK